MAGMIAGMLKYRIDRYKEIVSILLVKEELSEDQIAFLEKERITLPKL